MPHLFQGIRPVERTRAVRDILAGVQLAAMSIPQSLGYTKIADMPVVTGLYTLLLPLLAFATFGSSRYLVVSADSATAAIFASRLSGMATPGSAKYVALAGVVALLTAAFLLLARLLKLGFIADFLSQTVLVGFLTGVGFQVGIAVLGEMLGVTTSSRRTVVQLAEVLRRLPNVHLPTLAVSLAVLGIMLTFRRFAPKLPGPLIAVVGSILASRMMGFAGKGIAIIGPVAGGLPHLRLPVVSWKEVFPLISVAGSCTVMIITQSAATARIYAARHQEELSEDDDLMGLAAANVAAGFSGAFVVNGSPTQTAIVESAGCRSEIAHISTAAVVALVLVFLSKPLEYLPLAVLGALVFMVAIRLIDIRSLKAIRAESPGEFLLALTTALVVVAAGVERGIVLAMVLSLLRVVHHSYRPFSGVLRPTEGGLWRSTPVAKGAVTEPGLVIYRFGAALFYANARRFSEEVHILVAPGSSVRWLIVDAEAIPHVDYSAARVVRALQQDLTNQGVHFAFARVSPELQADLDRHHLTEMIGSAWIFPRLHDAFAAFEKTAASSRLSQ